MEAQLNLFSYSNATFNKGIELLSRLNFAEAEETWLEVLEEDETTTGANRAIELIRFWKNPVEQSAQLSGTEAAIFFHKHLEQHRFRNTAPDEALRKALKHYRTDLMLKARMFELESGTDIIDVSAGLKRDEALIPFIENLLESNPHASGIRARLADLLWENADYAGAKKHYVFALLANHQEIAVQKIQFTNLKKMIEKHGTEMACVYACLQGELPFCAPVVVANEKCVAVCTLVANEAEAYRKGNSKELLTLRKQIKQTDEEFFKFFMKRKTFFGR